MATTTYIFQDQIIPSGTLSFKVKTSFGAGGEVDTWDIYGERYFSEEVTINKETDSDGGELASENASFVIDNDASNLFEQTILAGLTDFNAWVSVEVRLNGLLIFGGVIRKSTIKYSTYYSYANRSGETSRKKITFTCVWYLDLLKNITAKEFGEYISADSTLSTSVTDTPSGEIIISNVCQIIKGCFAKLQTDYGFTYQLTFGDINYHFMSWNSGGAGTYSYPPVDYGLADARFTQYDDVGMSLTNSPSVIVANSAGVLGIFDDATDEYAETAYIVFVSALKSFALFIGFRTTPTFDMNAFVSTRSSGSSVEIGDILEQNDDVYTELSRDSVRINSAVSGNEYQKDFNSSGESVYSADNIFDFANDNDFGGLSGDRSQFSLVNPVRLTASVSTLSLIRYLGIGNNIVVNGNFNPDMTGWTTSTFSSDTNILFPDGCASDSSDVDRSVVQEYSVNANPIDDYIFSIYVYNTETIEAGLITIEWWRYDADGNSVFATSQSYGAVGFGVENIPQLIVSTMDNIRPSKIVVSFSNSIFTGITIGRAKLYVRRRNTCEIMGKLIEKYFDNPNIVRKRYLFNGIISSYSLSDFVNYNRTPYFINSIRLDLANNETEIEAINYPY